MLLAAVHAPILLCYRRWVPALLAADLGLAVWRAYVASPMYFGRQYDTWMHLAMIRRVLEHGPLPPDPYYVGYSAAPVLSLIHQLHGAVVWLTGQAIGDVWVWGIPLFTALIGLVAYFFHRELLRDSVAALFATLFFVAWWHSEWPHANYPRVVALGFYMLALGLLLRGLRNERRWGCARAGLVLGLSIATHPISGATGAMVAAAVLLGEWIFAARAGGGRALIVSALVFVAGSIVTAGPWIAYDFIALLRVDQLPRIIENPKLDLRYQLTVQTLRGLRAGQEVGDTSLRWLVLWGPPLLLGLARCLTSDTSRALRIYLAATLGIAAIVLGTPLREPLSDLVSPEYVARVLSVLPIPALAGIGLAWIARRARDAPARAAAALVLAVYVALPLRTTELRWFVAPSIPPAIPARPELTMLGDLFDQRVVLARVEDAYLLPFFTGAFVVWNHMGHSNPYAWNPARVHGARAIIAGRATPAEIRRYAEEFAVDFALLPESRSQAIDPLVASGAFRLRMTVPGYVVLERIVANP
jgi:hypothetical protein